MWEFMSLYFEMFHIKTSETKAPPRGRGVIMQKPDEVCREGTGKGRRRDRRKDKMVQEGLEGKTMPPCRLAFSSRTRCLDEKVSSIPAALFLRFHSSGLISRLFPKRG